MIDTCISLLTTDNREKEYRIYVTDILASILQSQYAERINIPRYIDILDPPKEEPQRSADEIINDISYKLEALGK